MLKSIIFLTFALSLNTARAASTCTALLKTGSQTSHNFQAHSLRRVDPQPWDVAMHGFVIDHTSLKGLDAAMKTISERDGTYPLIIDDQNNVVIDHRLPESSFADLDAESFVGNHLGLYNKLKNHMNQPPKVIFAGQIRVVGGKVISLVDQSGSFYFAPEDLGFTGPDKFTLLAAANQNRLEWASVLLKDLKVIDEQTTLKNFVEMFSSYTDQNLKNDGHFIAKEVAHFERACRASTSCWSKFLKLDKILREVSQVGTKPEIMSYFKKDMRSENRTLSLDAIQIWSIILAEGAMEFISKPGAVDEDTKIGTMLDNLIKNFNMKVFSEQN